ncbi:MAG: hypothetical protein A3F70_01200 [Acidobacteria bacterium RIFCSPLOWO2_12_FULL_67_14]|nr:MAG: hypothetical protein A3H29_12335 [Acidobacteria bacterium RIFCSPLOWO2_02_FULL_67_21]OFW38417.1 MAG: hypothetical protein A3F70_01200 [Acidobacteria bacterium RIFCSPLOWO2_12_FULL_67_14]
MKGLAQAIAASVAIAAVSTLADFIWAIWIPEHRAVYGLVHGALLFCAVGLVLGMLAGRPAPGALGGLVIGGAAAALFYAASPLAGYSAMFLAWCGVWMALAGWYARLRGVAVSGTVLARGAAAATASGLAFYSISGIWMPFDPAGWDYLLHFAAWTAAYVPGFAAILLGRRS